MCVICECVFKSCLLNSTSSGLLVIPGVSTLPCVTLMSSLKTIILKYFLVCVFLVSPCCVHRDNSRYLNLFCRSSENLCGKILTKCGRGCEKKSKIYFEEDVVSLLNVHH